VATWDGKVIELIGALFALALDSRQTRAELLKLEQKREEEKVMLRTASHSSDALSRLESCPGLDGVCKAIELVATADSTVLVTGETGTGKELIAQAIHDCGPRRNQVLVKVNCAALPRELIAAELFGHEPGAFTGATKRRLGRFELAHQGTLFLDEIAEISPETQVLLLRVLQERVIERIGGSEPIPVDVRVITATNRSLAGTVQSGEFRADLFYRLNVFPIQVPPLRNRPQDIPPLIEHFLERFNTRLRKNVRRVAPSTLNRLLAYHWPGNVRELENLIERAMIMVAGDTLAIDPDWLTPTASDGDENISIWSVRERQAILEALKRSGGKVYGSAGAAALLGLKPTTLYGKMRKLGIRRSDDED
jgi:formate hydrogenlyase transcriptional activator